MSIRDQGTRHVDVLGIGFGPSNISLAIALEETGSNLDVRFIEAADAAGWHPQMLLEGSDIHFLHGWSVEVRRKRLDPTVQETPSSTSSTVRRPIGRGRTISTSCNPRRWGTSATCSSAPAEPQEALR